MIERLEINSRYSNIKEMRRMPRLPLEGAIDLTYRCNNNCRHCWLRIPEDSIEMENELTFDEIKSLLDEARGMGCRKWSISGGEPMLREDFLEIFDYITRNALTYGLNTNGTLINPKIAELMKRKGSKMVALYGATAEVHDYITRHPGSFEATIQGFAYLKEAGAGFTVQLIPMRDNYRQFSDMIDLAKSLSPLVRVGAAWLYLTASGHKQRNREIKRQRLPPKIVVELNKPDVSYEEASAENEDHECACAQKSDRLFASCIDIRRDFHIDPYGQMTFCSFIKDPSLRFNLKGGNFKQAWEEFIPSLAKKTRGGEEYLENCGSCELRKDCRWCPVYGYLEHGRFSSKVEYLCAIAKENRQFKRDWEKIHRRYYQVAGITIQVDSDLPITDSTFQSKFKNFEVERPGQEKIVIRHHFSLPELKNANLKNEIYWKAPLAIFKNKSSLIYLEFSEIHGNTSINRVAVFNHDHTRANIYNSAKLGFSNGNLHSLTLFPTDKPFLGRNMAEKGGYYFHAAGVILDDKGLIIAGLPDEAKSAVLKMLRGKATILCDSSVIVRKHRGGCRVYGDWHYRKLREVSPRSAPLRAIIFAKKNNVTRLLPVESPREAMRELLSFLIKPPATLDWQEKTLQFTETIVKEAACYVLQFDKSYKIIELLENT